MKDMQDIILLFCVLCTWTLILATEDYSDEENGDEENTIDNDDKIGDSDKIPKSNCWMTLNAPHLFKVMDEIDERYAKVRNKVHKALMATDFDNDMISGFLKSRGAALREIRAFGHQESMIPSGINLGGYCMLRMADSVLFFHRMKLRNNTHFRIEALHNDFTNMQVRINLNLNDLHLKGAYERSLTDNDPSILIYAPTFGQVEFLLKDVRYKMEGRYRLIKNRLMIEIINSEIIANDILMTYINQAIENSAVRMEKQNLGGFMDRLKIDLDLWLKDYFNDYMIYARMDGIENIDKLSKYDKEKGTALEEYTDKAINAIVTRIRLLNADTIRLPAFTFKSIHGLQIKLYDGLLRGLDSMYRRSVATGVKQKDVRRVDTIVGFSNLKVVYKYEAVIPTGVPPLAGALTLSANELSAHLALALVKDPETVDLDIEFLDQMKPESLTVEGAASIMIANFKHLLEHQIVAMMSHTLLHGILMLRSLPSCEPFVPGQIPNKNNNNKKEDTPDNGPLTEYSSAEENNPETGLSDYSDEEDVLKAALRSTNKPPTTSINTQSNKNVKRKNKPDVRKKYKIRNKKHNYKAKQEI